MIRKLAALAGAGALLLGAAVPVFAHSWDWAYVNNSAVAVADTGGNSQGNAVLAGDDVRGDAYVSGNNDMDTGDATAYAGALVVANTHIGCGCDDNDGSIDEAYVYNGAGAGAYTGDNGQGNAVVAEDDVGSWHGDGITSVSGNNDMDTGSADSTARAWTIVNTHWGH